MSKLKIQSIKKELVIETSQSNAFKVFADNMDLWWPRSHHIGKSPMTEIILEGKLKGRWYSRHEDGTEVDIGYVLHWQPNDKLILAWQVSGDFKYDPTLITEVEVNFIPEGPTKTILKFEHRDLESLSGPKNIEGMDEGWGMILELYKKVI